MPYMKPFVYRYKKENKMHELTQVNVAKWAGAYFPT